MSYMSRYRDWFLSDYIDEETKAELESIEDNEEEIEDRFYKDLEFGTGGMRGKIGAGTNRMNKYTVRRATQGLANYLLNYFDDNEEKKSAVIAYDSRHKSREFAEEAARVLAANDIRSYIFTRISPTPELSYAVRKLGTGAGIMITASHNPPEYNGYKVYGGEGGQLVPDKARKVMAEIGEIDDFSLVNTMELDKAREQDLVEDVEEELEDSYLETVASVLPDVDLAEKSGDELSIVYTPLHGTGSRPIQKLMGKLGFSETLVVQRQAEADPDFSTVSQPNPEEEQAFTLALEVAESSDTDLIMATDPDCDRLGVMVPEHNDENFRLLSGNEIGVLMADYLLERMEDQGKIPDRGVIIKTIVTTEMILPLADEYGCEVMDVLTGFKYIGEKMNQFEEEEREFIFGFEESYGYLAGNYARDKDAVLAAALMAVLALYHQKENRIDLLTRLKELRQKYGYYKEEVRSIWMEGKRGEEKIAGALARLREEYPDEIAGSGVIRIHDYKEGQTVECESGAAEEIDLPESNVLQFRLQDDSLLTIRPSGTEPKLKVYSAVCANTEPGAQNRLEEVRESSLEMIEEILEEV
ncbi:alpha-phosphoglucomutase [Halarsenatibacter silvermanii]|uniref:Phosphoglucomutase n=2 Tax=Halarsenatibacter silvermanii TaxID=321763 RepID=A0A1G9LXY5_9FIRM|nr:alpha-phosphoglucomutase [Halarsenatibacter silvermanii]